jgi:16S rRNA (guanine966-N2)-methyltransferase
MRVVAGFLRGRRIDGPPESSGRQTTRPTTRPTTDKVREAVFNALNSMDAVGGAVVVDLFAGSGAMGIEALSRGAESCTFVENDRTALATLRRNIDHLGLADVTRVFNLDIASPGGRERIREIVSDAGLVVIDPPYGYDKWDLVFACLDAAPDDVVVVAETESRSKLHENPPAGWECLRSRDYGRTTVGFFAHSRA